MSKFFVSCARGLEPICAKELIAVGATQLTEVPGGVHFEGDQDVLYKAHLWSRTGNRFLLQLRTFRCWHPDELYDNLKKFKWETFFKKDLTFAVDCTLSGPKMRDLSHSQYAKLKAKDAIVDRLREKTGDRPSVDAEQPDIGVVIYIRNGECTLYLDATGGSLHERGYRSSFAKAPLKETLAAGILQLCEWKPTQPLIDPMCGSGTFLAEAALIAMNWAPGLLRDRFSFMNWPDFYEERWTKLAQEAASKKVPLKKGQLWGFDQDSDALKQARAAMKILGVADAVQIQQQSFEKLELPEALKTADSGGLMILNPPYGERLGDVQELVPLYKLIGDTFKQKCKGWRGAVFTGNLDLAKSIGLKYTRRTPLFNGPIDSRLVTFDLY